MYSLDTPESVTIRYDIAGVGTRFLAAIIDSILQAAILVALVIVLLSSSSLLQGSSTFVVVAIVLALVNAVLLGYHAFFEIAWNGQSPGKRALKLRVIGANGYPATPLALVIRNVLRLVDFLPSLYCVGLLAMMISRRSRRLGDLMAGTIVIKEGRDPRLETLSTPALGSGMPRAGVAPLALESEAVGGVRLQQLTREDEMLIRDFLQRRYALEPGRRVELGRRIAEIVHRHIEGPAPAYDFGARAIEGYLEAVIASSDAVQSRR
ncbi:MAG TPA: RDD family protein [Chloroflexota bacterium]|nr:RDD family protein [Chloroflexota bacterium]